jgi:hypothetical protein
MIAPKEDLLASSEDSLRNARQLAQKQLNDDYSPQKELALADAYLEMGQFYHQVYASGTVTVSI